jgi:hypothetical protein
MSSCDKPNVRRISLTELNNKIKKVKKEIIDKDKEKFGNLSDKQIMEALGIFLHDVDYYIDIKGGKKSRTRKTINKRNKKRNTRRKTVKTR